MTCAVPRCSEDAVMQGVCSGHWLEADEAVYGAERLEAELIAAREDALRAEESQNAELEMARQRRQRAAADPFDRPGERILNRIVDRFWADAGQGGRNNALAGAAWAAGRLVAGGELQHEETVRRLVLEATQAGLPWREAQDVVRGQVSRAKEKPRVLERKSLFTPDWTVRW